ncbi:MULTISPECIES: hypothetical protein [Streptomyces violaceusniger group]|uniref:Uncharacterized protein n=2 Tax=Streptomyces violaceusniger group TaxID=2839105 RepID=A0ABD5J8F8_9ACTN|nr:MULTISPECIES: hypothetical protein [Streptomyces]KUL43592.1 hypothetical protein ADL28_42655 [Streptomyces violaceusniger]MEE4584663.1 hypothetical protein [Streptomyces sp. DSM 41602]WTB06624.1 hypothetical protein OG546_21890 [Streptomyces antimycoticus]
MLLDVGGQPTQQLLRGLDLVIAEPDGVADRRRDGAGALAECGALGSEAAVGDPDVKALVFAGNASSTCARALLISGRERRTVGRRGGVLDLPSPREEGPATLRPVVLMHCRAH